jgi:acetyltransferase-like isoleucine patch superfamily enzyme
MESLISEQDLFNDYNELKTAAFRHAGLGDYESSLKLVEGCSRLAYEFNFIEKFVDEDVEELLVRNAKVIASVTNEFQPVENRILFYDYFAINNRGLTQQYITALIELNYDILYVISNDIFFNAGHDIIKQLKSYSKCRIVIYSQKLLFSERIVRLCKLIEEYKPTSAFLHLSPWDVIACSVFPLYNSFKKYFINLTDHAFWLGKNAFDVCLEFRNYGYHLSKELRGIAEEKLTILPYYPITQADETFNGLPAQVKGKIIGLSGGSGYKFVGDDWKFYKLIKSVIEKHDNFVFILVGMTGNARTAYERKVKQDRLQDKFIFLNDRYDIFQLIKHIDIYIGSYPFPGGLMSQLACLANKPVVTFINHEMIFSYIEDIAPFRDDAYKSIDNNLEFVEVMSKLIDDEAYRTEFAKLTSNGIITKEAFKRGLAKVLNNEQPFNNLATGVNNLASLSKVMSNWFLEIENTVNKHYYAFFEPHFRLLGKQLTYSKFFEKQAVYSSDVSFNLKQKIKSLLLKAFGLARTIKRKAKKRTNEFNLLKFRNLGSNAIVHGNFMVKNPSYMNVGKNFLSLNNLRLEAWDDHLGERFHPELVIGDDVVFNCDCHIGCINKVVIGNNVLLASRIYISDHSHGEVNKDALKLPPNQRSLFSKGPVVIEDNVWIGEGVCILPGVTVGRNSIIGANAVVTKTVPPNSVVAGIPARVINQF